MTRTALYRHYDAAGVRKFPVSAQVATRGASGSSVSPSVSRSHNPQPFLKTGEIVHIGKTPLPRLRESIKADAADLFWRTFDGASLHAKCDDAARKVPGVSASTFARIAGKETDKIEHAIIQAMLFWHAQKHGQTPPLPGLVARVQEGGE